MKGSINYLAQLKMFCEKQEGLCSVCPLNNKEHKESNDGICPFLSKPFSWDNNKIVRMVKI